MRSSRSRSASSARRIADGWIVASAWGASSVSTGVPRCLVTRKSRPKSACAAVAPRATSISGLDRRELGLEPGTAGGDLAPVRLRVDPALAARCPLEVLDHVRHVGGAPVDSSILERLIEQSAGGADERLSLTVLAVSRLLPDQHQPCGGSPGAEHGLRSRPPQLACGAARGSFAKRFQARSRRNQLGDVRQEFAPGLRMTPDSAAPGALASQGEAKPRRVGRGRDDSSTSVDAGRARFFAIRGARSVRSGTRPDRGRSTVSTRPRGRCTAAVRARSPAAPSRSSVESRSSTVTAMWP